LKNTITKNWTGGVAQGEGPEFKPQYLKKKKKLSWGQGEKTKLLSLSWDIHIHKTYTI
jgi:hypothetical protein